MASPIGLRFEERGSGTGLVATLLVVVLVVMGAVLVIGGYLLAAHRARVAADLGALSGAADVARGLDPCVAARAVIGVDATAGADGVRLTRCSWVGDQLDYVVSVEVAVRVQHRLPGLPRTVTARGSAGPVELADPLR